MKLSSALLILLCLFVSQGRAQKPMSDREYDGLKGPVQKVVYEAATLSKADGKLLEGERKLNLIETYDAAGNKIETEHYHKGRRVGALVYSYLDGDRVVKTDIPMGRGGNSGSIGKIRPRPETSAKPDPRYSWKLEYKYDRQGRRIEKQLITNRGTLGSRVVMRYDSKSNRKEESTYGPDGDRVDRTTYSYDAQGSCTEMFYDVDDDRYDHKYSYTYEFDAKGNWIKRVSSEWVTREGKSFFEPDRVTYRKITYF